MHLFIILILGN